jgi:hypothetical protein
VTGRTFQVTDTVRGTAIINTVRWNTLTVGGTHVVNVPFPAYRDVQNGVPILDAILANPIKAETEYLNRTVRLQGHGTVGKDERGFYVSFPTTAVAPGEVKPRPGIVAYIAKGDEAAFADLKRDATITIYGTVRTWRLDVPDAYRGVVIELDRARLMGVAHSGY